MSSTTIGVAYTPSPNPHPALSLLHSLRITYIRVQWVDLTAQIRFRVLPTPYFTRLLSSSARPGVSLTKSTLGLVFLGLAPGFGPNGEYVYVFDLDSLRTASYAPGHASVMGWFQEKHPSPGKGIDVDLCPRALLSRVVSLAKSQSGIEFLVGFETEFILLHPSTLTPVNTHGWSRSPALLTSTPEALALADIADALQRDGIELQMYHPEGAPGQYEVVTGPLDPLRAADALVHTRETIYNVAAKHGLRATLAPRVFADSSGSGTHVHVSVHSTHPSPPPPPSSSGSALSAAEEGGWSDGQEEEDGGGGIHLTPHESSFLSNLLAHLPALCAFTLPTYASYARMQDGIWSGGTYACWGVEHRETPVRVCNPFSPSTRNFEVKMMDGTSSPYLALAAILGCGAAGVRDKRPLSVQPIVEARSAAEMSERERESLGISSVRLPGGVREAREALRGDGVLRGVVGEEFVDAYCRVNEYFNERYDVGEGEEKRRRLIEDY